MQLKPLRNFAQHFTKAPVQAFELVQLGRGDIALMDCWLYGEDSFVNIASSKARSSWTILGADDMMALMLPLSWTGDYCVNGWISEPGDVYLLDGRHDYCNIGQNRKVLFVAFKRQKLTEEIWTLNGNNSAQLPFGHRKLSLGPGAASRLSKIINRVFRSAIPSEPGHGQFNMTPFLENALLTALANWLISLELFSNGVHLKNKTAFRRVKSAREAFDRIPAEKLTISAMCRAAGVGRSQLHQNFVEVFDEAPWQFILKRRLTFVREQLLSIEEPAVSVKDVALANGFLSGGHFAKEYREMFDELPSETLSRVGM